MRERKRARERVSNNIRSAFVGLQICFSVCWSKAGILMSIFLLPWQLDDEEALEHQRCYTDLYLLRAGTMGHFQKDRTSRNKQTDQTKPTVWKQSGHSERI